MTDRQQRPIYARDNDAGGRCGWYAIAKGINLNILGKGLLDDLSTSPSNNSIIAENKRQFINVAKLVTSCLMDSNSENKSIFTENLDIVPSTENSEWLKTLLKSIGDANATQLTAKILHTWALHVLLCPSRQTHLIQSGTSSYNAVNDAVNEILGICYDEKNPESSEYLTTLTKHNLLCTDSTTHDDYYANLTKLSLETFDRGIWAAQATMALVTNTLGIDLIHFSTPRWLSSHFSDQYNDLVKNAMGIYESSITNNPENAEENTLQALTNYYMKLDEGNIHPEAHSHLPLTNLTDRYYTNPSQAEQDEAKSSGSIAIALSCSVECSNTHSNTRGGDSAAGSHFWSIFSEEDEEMYKKAFTNKALESYSLVLFDPKNIFNKAKEYILEQQNTLLGAPAATNTTTSNLTTLPCNPIATLYQAIKHIIHQALMWLLAPVTYLSNLQIPLPGTNSKLTSTQLNYQGAKKRKYEQGSNNTPATVNSCQLTR